MNGLFFAGMIIMLIGWIGMMISGIWMLNTYNYRKVWSDYYNSWEKKKVSTPATKDAKKIYAFFIVVAIIGAILSLLNIHKS